MRRPARTLAWTSVAALLAAAAFAEQPAATPASSSSQAYPLTNSINPRDMLADLSGIFRVDLRINPNQWYGNTAMLNPDGTPAGNGQIGVNGSAGMNQPASNQNNGSTTPGQSGQTGQPNQGRDPSMQPGDMPNSGPMGNGAMASNANSALNGAVNVRGYSEKRWTLGRNILQETCIIPDLAQVIDQMESDSSNANAGRNAASVPGGEQPAQNSQNAGGQNAGDDMEAGFGRPSMEAVEANRMFQGVSYLAFNPSNNSVTLTSMDSRQSDVLSATGQFLPGLNRIEFNANVSQSALGGSQFAGQSNGQMNGQQNTGASTPQNPSVNNPNNFNSQTDPNRPAPRTPGTTGSTNNTANPNANTPNQPGNDPSNPASRGTSNPSQPNTGNQPANQTNTGNQPVNPNQPGNRIEQTRDQNAINATNNGMSSTGQNSLNSSAGAFDNVRVVLEFISPDQHRVTLYRLNPGTEGAYYNPYYVPQNQGTLDANGRLVDAQGRQIDNSGRFVDAQGRLVDAQGRVLDENGRPIEPGDPRNANDPNNPNAPGSGTSPGTSIDPNDPTGRNSAPTNDPNNPGTRQPQPGDPNRPATNVPNDPSRPRVTGAAPSTTGGQPANTVPDAPGTRPNNAAEPNSVNQPQQNGNTGNQNNQPNQPGTNANQPNQPVQPGTVITQPGTTGTANTPNQFNQPGMNNQFNQNFPGNISAGDQGTWVVIWEATYTRVEGAEASRYRNFLQRADQLIQASIRDENDR